jgi:hypothetical protein
MASLRSGQWTPPPRPIRRYRSRSWRVPWARRGYHASGTTTVRPSAVNRELVIGYADLKHASLSELMR